jgi:hypothetical protein
LTCAPMLRGGGCMRAHISLRRTHL